MGLYPAVLDVSTLDGRSGFSLTGIKAHGLLGFSVSSAGDINGDGFDDLVVGTPTRGYSSDHGGGAYVVYGHAAPGPASLDASSLHDPVGFQVLPPNVGSDRTGESVASAGDVNGDGIDDLLIGAGNYSSANSSYVVFGTGDGFGDVLDLNTIDGTNGFRMYGGGKAYEETPISVASAGDINGDGFDDVIYAASGTQGATYGEGQCYIVFGKAAGFDATIDVQNLDGVDGFRIDGQRGSYAGASVSSAGDVNGDGLDDLLIGAPGQYGGSGKTYVVYGRTTGFDGTESFPSLVRNGGGSTIIDSAGIKRGLGQVVSTAGDVNGDGRADLLVSEPRANVAYILLGDGHSLGAKVDLANPGDLHEIAITGKGIVQAASAGDVNGDGFSDVILGAKDAAYVVFGKADADWSKVNLDKLHGSDGFKLVDGSSGDGFGVVGQAGDLNGDGLSDLIVGAPTADPDGTDSGEAYVVYARQAKTAVDLVGTAASQTLAGGRQNDTLSGMDGNDHLFGNGGGDLLDGGRGDDTLTGGESSDTMTGGSGADVFRFTTKSDAAMASDRITDLSNKDVIDLSLIDANGAKAGDTAFRHVDAFDGHRGQLVLSYDASTHDTWLLLDIDGDGQKDMMIALTGDHADFNNFVL